MGLHGQARALDERGYAMAALLVTLAVMAIMLTVLMPAWRHEARREKEAELVFRGEQYARAIALFRAKNSQIPNALPPSVDVLVSGRYLRKKYKDPMTADGEFFVMPMATQAQPGMPQGPQAGGGRAGTFPQPARPGGSTVAIGGIMGVRSKSTENSLRSYRGATRYDQWMFTFNTVPRPGGSMPLANTPDGRVGPDGRNPNPFGPGGRGPRGGTPGQPGGPGRGFNPGGFPTSPPIQGPGGRPGGPGTGGPGRRGGGF
jgi:type II secretory pathway pseudopilin PulG